MKKKQLSPRAVVYSFDNNPDYTTYVYKIRGPERTYLIDTAYGPLDMQQINRDLGEKERKDMLIINTHFHWDHIWGNCFFDRDIAAHRLCRDFSDSEWETQLTENSRMCSGRVKKKLPTILFEKSLFFPGDQVELIYSPGHTADSISVIDHEDNTLYAGDNLERPLIYVENADLKAYLSTLIFYKNLKTEHIHAGHTLNLTRDDIDSTIAYLEALQTGKTVVFETDYEKKVHEANLLKIKQ